MGDPHPEGNCGRAGPSTQQVQARSWTSGLEGAYFTYGQPLAALGIVYSFSSPLSEPLEGAPQRHEPAQVGLPQTTPLLSVWGRKWGPTPLGSMNI